MKVLSVRPNSRISHECSRALHFSCRMAGCECSCHGNYEQFSSFEVRR